MTASVLRGIARLTLGTSAQAELGGMRCGDQERAHIDAFGVGFDEHTTCAWGQPPRDAAGLSIPLTCETTSLSGDGPIHTVPVPGPVYLTIVTHRPDPKRLALHLRHQLGAKRAQHPTVAPALSHKAESGFVRNALIAAHWGGDRGDLLTRFD